MLQPKRNLTSAYIRNYNDNSQPETEREEKLVAAQRGAGVTFAGCVGGAGGRSGCGGLVDVEKGIRGERGNGGGAGVGVARLLLEEVVDVVGADVGAPRLLPLPRALRRLPHRRRCSPSLARGGGMGSRRQRRDGEVWGVDERVLEGS